MREDLARDSLLADDMSPDEIRALMQMKIRKTIAEHGVFMEARLSNQRERWRPFCLFGWHPDNGSWRG
jgi:hypothetical protein